MPKISVIILAHNRAYFLKEAIESVISQTFQDWELIVLDDGSTDNTQEVVDRFCKKDSRIRYFYQKNKGISYARAKSVSLARGEVLAWLDDDDLYYPNKLQEQLTALEENPEAGFVYSYIDMVDQDKKFLRTWPEKPAMNYLELIPVCPIQTNAILVRKACFERLGAFRADWDGNDDYEMWLRIARHYPIGFLPICVGAYRWHAGNISRDLDRRLENILSIYRILFKASRNDSERFAIIRSTLFFTYDKALEAYSKKAYAQAAYFFRKALRFHPAIGTMIPWGRFSNPFYRLVRPYLALIYCEARSAPRILAHHDKVSSYAT